MFGNATTRRTTITRVSTVIVATFASLLLAACASSAPAGGAATDGGTAGAPAKQESGVSLAQVKKAGELVIGTEGTYRPFTYAAGGSGALTGYDVDVITAVAKKLGVKPRFRETQWDAMFAGLNAGRFDVIANQVSIDAARKAVYSFSLPYTVSPGVLVVADGSNIRSFKDLKGRSSAQSLTSDWYKVAKDAGANVQVVEGWAQAVELLKQGRIDATVNDQLTYLDYVQTQGGDGIKVAATAADPSRQAFPFRKGSNSLVAAVDKALTELRADGTLASLSTKYFGRDVSQ